jgi:excisionase family DNA binding protein
MLTVKRTAEMLNVSPGLIYALCATGKLEHERYGLGRGTIRIREDAIQDFQNRAKFIHGRRVNPQALHHKSGTFTHLDAQRLEQAWKNRANA